MGLIRRFPKEKLVVGVLASPGCFDGGEDGAFSKCLRILEERFGTADYLGPRMDFAYTDYYAPEMGPGLVRTFLAFQRLVDPADLASIKISSNEIEDRFAMDGRRRINLDPGLLSLGRFALATTKNRAHRLPLADGIYAELTLLYEKGAWRALPWTYPDWATAAYAEVLSEIREKSKEALKREGT